MSDYLEWADAIRHKNTLRDGVSKIPYLDAKEDANEQFEELERKTPISMQLDFTAPLCINEYDQLAVTHKNVQP